MKLEESTFLLYAAHYYDNPHCQSIEEFEDDLKRITNIRKLLSKYDSSKELSERLILNHLIVLYNCFGPAATNMLFLKLKDYHCYIKPFIEFLNFMPEFIEYDNKKIHESQIKSDEDVKEKLERTIGVQK